MEGRDTPEHCATEDMSKSRHAEKSKHTRSQTVTHSDVEWRPDDESEEYASSGWERQNSCTIDKMYVKMH